MKNLENISVGLLSLIVFLVPLNLKFISPLIGLWAILTFIYIVVGKSKIQRHRSLFFLLIFYVLLIIGLIWTDDMKAGTFDLEVKMSLVIFPLVFMFKQYRLNSVRWIIFSFFAGLFLSSLLHVYGATVRMHDSADYNTFFYVDLANPMHPTYASFYYVTAMIIIIIDLKSKLFLKKTWVSIVLMLFYFSYNLMLLSKIGVIGITLFLAVFIVIWSVKKRRIISPLIAVFVLIGGVCYSYQKYEMVQHRVGELIYGLFPEEGKKNNGSTGIRLQVWTQGIELIKEKPLLGHGTGDVKDVLMQKYIETEMGSAYDKKLNAHNQFLQIAISIGLIGFVLFIIVLFESIRNGLKQNNLFIVSFALMFVIYALTESMLESQAGTIFFGLFFSLLNQKAFFTNEVSKC